MFNERERLGLTSHDRVADAYFLAMFSHLLSGLEGKRILDIGCGGEYALDKQKYPPTFPRFAKKYAVDIVGLDPTLYPDEEEFEAIKGYVEDLPREFEPEGFDGVLLRQFWNQPHFLMDIEYTMALRQRTYGSIYRLLRPNGVSINQSNQARPKLPLSPRDELEAIGFETVYYFSHPTLDRDLVILRKPAISPATQTPAPR